MFLSREGLLGLTEPRYLDETIYGHKFRIRNLTEKEKSDYEASVLSSEGKYSVAKIKRQRRRLIVLCLCDANNAPLMKEGDEEKLRPVDGAITSRLYDVCREHCGFEEGDIEALVKNSGETRAVDSLSA